MVSQRNAQRRRNYLTFVEQDALLKASKRGRYGIRDHAICLLFLAHGFRASELAMLRVEDVHLDDRNNATVDVWRLKNSISRPHPLGPETKRALKRWLKIRPKNSGFDTLFLSEQGFPFHRNSLSYLVKSWADRAMIAIHVHPHTLRHSCGFRVANKPGGSRDTRYLQEWLGHKNPVHTAIYTRLSTEEFTKLGWGI